FHNFVILERRSIESTECEEFWLHKMDDSSSNLLPSPPAARGVKAAEQIGEINVQLPPELSQGLRHLAGSTATSLKSVLLAAHMRVLSRLSGQTDITTGLISNGRPEDAGGEQILGLFLNTLPFRMQLQGGSWEELIRQAFEQEQEIVPFRRYPLAQIQRDLARDSLSETVFNYVHFHVFHRLQNLEGIELLSERYFAQTNFPLLVNFILDPNSSSLL